MAKEQIGNSLLLWKDLDNALQFRERKGFLVYYPSLWWGVVRKFVPVEIADGVKAMAYAPMARAVNVLNDIIGL